MKVINGLIVFEDNENTIWEKFLDRKLKNISPNLLRELGEARVRELQDENMHIWARMGAMQLAEIPTQILH